MIEIAVVIGVVWVLLLALHRSVPSKKKSRRRGRKRKSKRKGGGKLIYIYRLKDGRKTFYVGQTVSPNLRLQQHIEDGNRWGTKKQQYIYWMGRKRRTPKMQIITKTKSPNKANSLEVKYIQMWGTHNTLHR